MTDDSSSDVSESPSWVVSEIVVDEGQELLLDEKLVRSSQLESRLDGIKVGRLGKLGGSAAPGARCGTLKFVA